MTEAAATKPPRWARVAATVAALPLPLRVVLLAVGVLHAVGLSWGMPASDSWDNDGVAPRDFLPGLAATFTPGDYYTYPPLQLAILAILTAPITLVAIVRAGTTRLPVLLGEILAVPYMTAMTMVARVVTVAMSLGIVIAIAKIAEEIAPPSRARAASTFAAIAASLSVSFTYYAHMSNLDVPYMFWASLSALALVRTIARGEPKRLRHALPLAALAIATKDQAYAIFVFGAPAALVAWLLLDPWARKNVRAIVRETVISAVIAVVLLLAIDGAITNPSGFRARLAFLSGSASQDYATYSRDVAGRLDVAIDLGRELAHHYPSAIVAGALYVVGIVVVLYAAKERGGRAVAAAFVPLALALSFSLGFNMVARRVEERFTLPQVLFMAIYAGAVLERLWSLPKLRLVARAVCVAIVGRALFDCIALDANLVLEPRYQTEAFLQREARPGDTIEVYGLNVYLPRLPKGPRAVRVGATAPERRGPIPGLEEVQAPLGDIDSRAPRFVVVSECYIWRYRVRPKDATGRVVPKAVAREAGDADAALFFERLFAGALDYRLVHEARFTSPVFRRMELHASVGCPTFTFERTAER